MTNTIKILNLLARESLSQKQLYKRLGINTNSIRGRLFELTKRGLIRKKFGRYEITEPGRLYTYDKPQEFLVKKNNSNVKVTADNIEQAQNMAKLIYGTGYEIECIG